MKPALDQAVRERPSNFCEYCQLSAELSGLKFSIDHVIARQHGGSDELDNLALACVFCNRHKGPNIAGIDPVTSQMTPLFNPRIDRWTDHLVWRGPRLAGLTPAGRTTIAVLNINNSKYVAIRQLLIAEGVFPPRQL